ncbi:hypothetical protein E3Q02_02405 [Wallemia mellicola]|uniref:Mtf2-like C-terminal domain-containing protein n=1 Tax=Wallemia mellicola TaxID=1708541 RepID=A0AB38MX74_9BASI|nr:hypothetical protein E3Q02_02405 [Wallemia mellicola]
MLLKGVMAISLATLRRSSWIAFSRALSTRIPREDDSGLGAPVPAVYGGRTYERRPAINIPVEETYEERHHPIDHPKPRRQNAIAFSLEDKLIESRKLRENRVSRPRVGNLLKQRRIAKQRILDSDKLKDLSRALIRHDRKAIRKATSRLNIFGESAIANLLIPGLVFLRDIKTLAYYIQNIRKGVLISEKAFIILLNGVHNGRIGINKNQRDQARARRSYSLSQSKAIAAFDHNSLGSLIDDAKPTQQALINVLPIVVLQKGLFQLPTAKDGLSVNLSLACLRWLLRTGYEDSAANLVDNLLDSYQGKQKEVFAINSLNIYLKSLLEIGEPAGPKFEYKYRPRRYFKEVHNREELINMGKGMIEVFEKKVPQLKLNKQTEKILNRMHSV